MLTISEGKPVDCMEEVAPNKIIFNDSSPILLRIKLQCEACKKQLKISFCKGIVYIKTIDCPSCEKVGSWNIRDIECNYPIWGGGVKIDNHERIEPAPSVIRVMGCVCCFKFSNSNTMRCGCLLCSECAESS